MILLLAFAFLAGAATAITPCVLPVLPALLSASGTGGRRRPAGIVSGLTLTYTITIIGIASVVHGVGIGDGTLRTISICLIAVFGVTLLVPRAADWLQLRLTFLQRIAPRGDAQGFWSGLPVGGALGFVYAPCAGPILAAVIAAGATSGTTSRIVAVGIACGLGSAVVLFGLAVGGRKLMDRVRRAGRGVMLERSIGAVMVLTAVLMFTDVDLSLERGLADHLPAFLTNPTNSLETSGRVTRELADLRGKARFAEQSAAKTQAETSQQNGAALPGVKTPTLPVLGNAPDFADTGQWFNTAPLTMAKLRGRVVLIDFWTYTCINCLRTLPYLKAWDAAYRTKGLTIVGVHTPEFPFEHDASNVAAAIKREGLRYPVVQDNKYGTWNAWGNQYWPADYLVDAKGRVREAHFGEGEYKQTEAAIRALLAERGDRTLGGAATPHGTQSVASRTSPETYIGTARAEGFSTAPKNGTRDYTAERPASLPQNGFSLGGRWQIDNESGRAVAGAKIEARIVGKAAYLVLSSAANVPRHVRVELDGKPIGAPQAGADVHGGVVTVRAQRLYNLVRLPKSGEHLLTLSLDPGVSGFAFTFG
ncbi:MAG TPA: cytochrome c biogenesis protein DipZ [Solirubrobacteraceae bacterium]|nr:cytochrome c biogenesis protein DipZ [Solirubrobacteraceae bacterium]